MKFGNKLRTVAVVAAVSLALTAAGCGGGGESANHSSVEPPHGSASAVPGSGSSSPKGMSSDSIGSLR